MKKNLKPALIVGASVVIAIGAVMGAMSTGSAQSDAQQAALPPVAASNPTLAVQAPPAASKPIAILEPAPIPASTPVAVASVEKALVATGVPASAPEQPVEKVDPAPRDSTPPEKHTPARPSAHASAPPPPTPKTRAAMVPPTPRPTRDALESTSAVTRVDPREVELAKSTNQIFSTSIIDARKKLNFVRASTDSVTIAVGGKPREYKVGQTMGNGEKVLAVHHDVEGGIIITTNRQTLVLNP